MTGPSPSSDELAPPAAPRAATTLLRAAALAWAAALALNLLLFVLASGPLGIELLHPDPPGSSDLAPITAVHVIVSTTVGALAALVAAAILRRVAPRPRSTFVVLATVATVLSLGGPVSIEGASVGNTVVLLAMHVLAAAALVPLLGRALPATRHGEPSAG